MWCKKPFLFKALHIFDKLWISQTKLFCMLWDIPQEVICTHKNKRWGMIANETSHYHRVKLTTVKFIWINFPVIVMIVVKLYVDRKRKVHQMNQHLWRKAHTKLFKNSEWCFIEFWIYFFFLSFLILLSKGSLLFSFKN